MTRTPVAVQSRNIPVHRLLTTYIIDVSVKSASGTRKPETKGAVVGKSDTAPPLAKPTMFARLVKEHADPLMRSVTHATCPWKSAFRDLFAVPRGRAIER